MESTAMAGKHVTRAALAEELRICVEEGKSTWSKLSSFLTNDAGGAFLVTAFCMIAVPCIWLFSLSLFLYILRNSNIKQGQERLKQATNREWASKDQIEHLESVKEEKEAKEEESEEKEKVMEELNAEGKRCKELNHIHCADHSEITTLCENPSPTKISPGIPKRLPETSGPPQGGSNPTVDSKGARSSSPEAPVFVAVPNSKGKQNKLEHMTTKKVEVNRFKVQGASILQSKVELSHEAMQVLHDLADEGSKIDNKFTVQLSRWRLFIRTADGVKKLKLDDAHQVPTILHASYAAGKLTIQGLNLTGAEIMAATIKKCITLQDFTKEEVLGGLQIWTSIVRLPSNNLSEVFVYATKSIRVEDHEGIIVSSSVINIQDDNLRTVLRVGIPSTIGLIYMIIGFICLKGWHFMPPAFVWILPLIAVALTQILPQRTEDAIKRFFERIGLAMVTLYFATWSLFFKQDPEPGSSRHGRCLQQGKVLDLSECTEQDGSMGRNELREQDEVVHDDEIKVCSDDEYEIVARLIKEGRKREIKVCSDDECEIVPRQTKGGRKREIKGNHGTKKKKVPKGDEGMEKISPKGDEGKEKISPKGDGSKKKTLPKAEDEPQCFAYEEYVDENRRVLVRKRDVDAKDTEAEKTRLPFKFVYGLKDKKIWHERDYFKVYSPDLIRVLHEKMPEKIQLLGSKWIKLYVSDFFHKRDELKMAMELGEEGSLMKDHSGAKCDTDKLTLHLKHMWQFIDTSFQEVLGKYEAMKSEGCVSWDMLWAFYPSGTEVEYRCKVTGEKLCGKVQHTKYSLDRPPRFMVGLEVWDYNCKTWQSYSIRRSITQFAGGCNFTCLETHPLEFKSDPDEVGRKFLAKGAWFGTLSMKTRNRFMYYKGLVYMGNNKEAVNGRVMIDLASFAKMKPNYSMENATPPSEILRTNQVETIDISTDDNRKYAPAIVYGFSFQSKKWGTFDICGFEENVFNQLAFDAVVMDKAKKDIVYGLVQKYERNQDVDEDVGHFESKDEERVDPIVGKGEGFIFLCYGPPGTGKTFTAETISEKLKAPLWSLSVSELGTTPNVLEEKLVKILDVAASWGAILLLDEADIYLERRTSVDLERSAMTGIFLRNLEYYRGVLFLTTNRVVSFDEAFCSRISMFLYYAKHAVGDRRIIWKNLLEPLKLQDLDDHLLDKFASYHLNAREIRNVVQVARTLAKRNGENVNGVYLTQSLETLADSIEELKRVTGESAPQTSMSP